MAEDPEKTRPEVRPPDPLMHLDGQTVDRYEVGERLGAGGMGEVYRAWDPLLKRTVALKRLSGLHLGDAESRDRLLHEARALSSLSHPAIASVYDVVDSHEQLFIVEEFVAGTSLRQQLDRPVDLDTFLSIAEGCLSALEEADRQGIVHCDIKPENIVLTEEGAPKILDFGLARRAVADGGEATVATRTVSVSSELRGGTTSYMAPEALVASRADSKSDIWSLGVVFYEMLAGRHPFRRDSATATATSILTEHPDEPSEVRPGIPTRLNDVVMSMLAKEPGERAESATALLSAVRGQTAVGRPAPKLTAGRRVRWPFRAAVAVAVVGLAAWAVWQWRPVSAASGPPVYLAVEPFENLTADPSVDAFAVGFLEAVAERVGEGERLYVVSPDVDYFDVAARLRGGIQLAVDRLRVNYEVVDAEGAAMTGAVIGGMDELFELRDRLARNVSRTLASRFDLEPLPAGRDEPPPTNPSAYAAFLYGRGCLARPSDEQGVREAAKRFEEAIESDPEFVAARVGLAEALWRASLAAQDAALGERARQLARDAVEMAPGSALAHRVLGQVLLEAGETEAAEAELRQAFELDPEPREASQLLARAQVQLGRPEDAERTFVRAVEASPDDWVLHRNLGQHLFRQSKFGEAATALERVVALTPGNVRHNATLGAVYFYAGHNVQAIDAYLESIAIEPTARAFSNIAMVYQAEGRIEEAATNLEAALALDDGDYRVWGNVTSVYELLHGQGSDAAARARARSIELAEAHLANVPNDAFALSLVAGYYVGSGRTDDAIDAVERALDLAAHNLDVLYHAAGVFESLGERPRALEMARRALEKGFPLHMMEDDPKWQDLVSSPEFREIVANVQSAKGEET